MMSSTPSLRVWLRNSLRGGVKLFDYGCGWGEFASLMSTNGFEVTAFDDADEMIARARDTFPAPTFYTSKEFYESLPTLKDFDIVTSNLVLCILPKDEQDKMLTNMKSLVKDEGTMIISLCHPCFDYIPDSLVSVRTCNDDAVYSEEFQYTKEVKENGITFHDYHRPLAYYSDLFAENGLQIVAIKESDVMGTNKFPDFIVFVLQKIT